jgi:hypothetical protein
MTIDRRLVGFQSQCGVSFIELNLSACREPNSCLLGRNLISVHTAATAPVVIWFSAFSFLYPTGRFVKETVVTLQ